MKTILFVPAVLGSALALVACDTPAENKAQEDLRHTADAVEHRTEATADALEKRGGEVDGPAQERLEAEANAVRERGEATADALENEADAVDNPTNTVAPGPAADAAVPAPNSVSNPNP